MGKGGLLVKLLDQLGLGAAAAQGGVGAPVVGAPPAIAPDPMQDGNLAKQTTDLFNFRKRLDHALSDHRADTQGHIFVLRLDRVQQKLGDRWDKTRDRLYDTIESIIARHTVGGDLFIRYDDLSYLLIFLTLGEKEGQLRSIAIADEIAHRLTGTEKTTDVVKPQSVQLGQDGRMAYVDLPPLNAIVEQTIRSLTERAPIIPVSPVAPPAAEPSAFPSPPVVAPGGEAPELADVSYVYRPLLAVSTSVISTFLCIPSRKDRAGRYLSGYEVLDNRSDPNRIYALDRAVLRAGAAEIRDLIAKGGHSLIALPVHFETLADRRRRLEYTQAVDALMQGVEKRVIFEMTELPEGIPQNRILELVSALKPRCRSIIARFAPDHKNFVAYRVAGLHAVGIDLYNSGRSETDLMAVMESFVSEAKKNQLKCYAEGIRTLSLFSIALTLGFDYIAGYALSAVAGNADEIHKFRLEEPYLAFLKALRPHDTLTTED